MRKIFIDCGGLDGCSVRYFLDTFDNAEEYEIYTFEPNAPYDQKFLEIKNKLGKKYSRIKKAVSNFDGKIDFYINDQNPSSCTTNSTKGEKPGCGSNILGNVTKTSVDCIDLDKWIRSNFKQEDFIILKLDVEGAEYDIVPKMIKNKTFFMVDELHMEWHPEWCEVPKVYGEFLSEMISKIYNVKINNNWNTMGY